jgi:hypothetical protein
MGGTSGIFSENRNAYKFLVGKPEGKIYLA